MNARDESNAGPEVLAETREGVRTITLDRPGTYNALSTSMIAALDAALDAAAADEQARVVVLAARGKAFCAGHDLREMRAHVDLDWQRKLFADCSRMMLKLVALPQPVIARVHGSAVAAGCQLVAMCDLAIAGASAKFGLPGVNAGIFCTTPSVGVGRNVSRKRAMELLVTGRLVDAATAADWGLVNHAVPDDRLDDEVASLAASIAAKSRSVLALGKRAFYAQAERGLADAYALGGETMACNMLDPDAAEGIDAFLGKRPPAWRG